LSVTALGSARLAWHAAFVPRIHALAVSRAAIAADSVAIVALLIRGQLAVATLAQIRARLPRGGAKKVRFSLAEAVATVT